MAMEIQNIQDYTGYIKCGEILKSPLKSYENPFILKCFECEEIHFLLESFIIHIQEHCQEAVTSSDGIETRTRNSKKQRKKAENEVCPTENLVIKLEESNDLELNDPLVELKNETVDEKPDIKEEKAEDQDKTSDIDQHDDFEEIILDSADEYHPDESESEEEFQITNKKPIKKPKIVKKSLPFVEEFMNSKTNVTTLIEAYKTQPYLWNKYFPYYRSKEKKQQFLQEITQDINTKLDLEFTYDQVEEIISYLCRKHRENLRKLQEQKENGKNKNKVKPCWYSEHLYFLKTKEIIQLDKLDATLPDLKPEQIIQIIEIYKKFAHLWNTTEIEYVCSNKRYEAHMEMLKILETNMNLKITKNILEVYLNNIHMYFSREKQIRLNNTTNNVESSSKSEYFEHMSFLYEHEGPFTCSECSLVFSKSLLYIVHKSTHDGTIPLKCRLCGKELKTITSYTSHAKRHFEDLEFGCDECDRKFFNHYELKTHKLAHTDDRSFCCEICGSSYRHLHSLKKHLRRHEKRFTHTCNICSQGYYTKDRYTDHMNSHMNIRSHICEICSKAFITRRALLQHKVVHEDIRRFACKLCGTTFKHKAGVNQHMKTHGIATGEDKKL